MNDKQGNKELKIAIIKVSRYLVYISIISVTSMVTLVIALFAGRSPVAKVGPVATSNTIMASIPLLVTHAAKPLVVTGDAWRAPDELLIPKGKNGEMIHYGQELLAHTAKYFGPKGEHSANN